MRLVELIGKKAIRTKPVVYESLVYPTELPFEGVEDMSYTDRPIYVRGVTVRKIRYRSPIGNEYKWWNSTFDVGGLFDDDNWELYESKEKV